MLRHGDRWAVLEADAESPTKEFDTREAAESAAHALAAGGKVVLRDDDPTGLDQAQDEPAVEGRAGRDRRGRRAGACAFYPDGPVAPRTAPTASP